jgi:hypothetical protein
MVKQTGQGRVQKNNAGRNVGQTLINIALGFGLAAALLACEAIIGVASSLSPKTCSGCAPQRT